MAVKLADYTIPGPTAHHCGREDDYTSFRTARAKEYPGHLCEAMTRSLLGSLCQRRFEQGERVIDSHVISEYLWTWFEEVEAVSATSFATDFNFWPDYQPR